MSELRCPINAAAEERPGSLALLTSHRQLTYRDYDRICAATLENIQRAGLRTGDLLAIALPNGVQYPIIFMALMRLGAIACPVSVKLPIRALLRKLEAVHCKDIVSPYGISHTSDVGRLYSLSPAALVDERECDPGRATLDENQPASIFFTSGSTGEPKPVLHRYGNHYRNAEASNANIALKPNDRWLVALPMYRVAGVSVLFRCAIARAAAAIPRPREALGEALVRYEATHVSLVATQLYRLLEQPSSVDALRRMKAILLGGSAVPESLVERAHGLGLPIHVSYGLTEMASQAATTPTGASIECLRSSGAPLRPDTVRISATGEIEVRGPALFEGYVRDGALERPLTADGWFPTGDLGWMDAEGRLHVAGRRDNMFVSGGENIQPEEIERHLCAIPGVVRAVVTPVNDPEYGSVGVAFVQTDGGAHFSPRHLREKLCEELPRFKVPKAFLVWPDHLRHLDVKASRGELKRAVAEAPPTLWRTP